MAITRRDYYNTGDNSQLVTKGTVWHAQTFEVDEAYNISFVLLKLHRYNNCGTVTVSIRGTVDGYPTSGPDLCSATLAESAIIPTTPGKWYPFNFPTEPLLEVGKKYAIVVRAPSGDINNSLKWRWNSLGSDFTEGYKYSSNDSGETWDEPAELGDCMFETYSGGLLIGTKFFAGGETVESKTLRICSFYEYAKIVLEGDGVVVLGTYDCSVVVTDADFNVFAVSNDNDSPYKQRIAKYKPDLTLDTTWGSNGYVDIEDGSSTLIYDLVIASTGEVFVARGDHVRKYNSTGSLIWNKDYAAQIGAAIYSMAIASDDSLVLGCGGGKNPIRILSDGTVSLTYPTGDNVTLVYSVSIGKVGGNDKVCISESRSTPTWSIFQFPIASTTRDWCVNGSGAVGGAKKTFYHSNEYLYGTGAENIVGSGYDLIKMDPADGSIVVGSDSLATIGESISELSNDRIVVGTEESGSGNNVYVFDEDCILLSADPIPISNQYDILGVSGVLGIPPEITDQPDDTTVCVGQPVTLSITATGTPTPTYQWYEDDVIMSGETSSTLSFYASSTAIYKCKASNDFGVVTSDGAVVTVNPNLNIWNIFRLNVDQSRGT